MEIHFKIIGVLLIILAFVHMLFPKHFNWNEELRSLSLINRQMMAVHTFFIGLVIFLMALLCLTSAGELATTVFGKKISFGFGIFWITRLFIHFFGYSSELWKGKRFETCMHILFSLLWTYLSFIFFAAFFI